MKIIDLLNKIANGEEVPRKIKYDGEIYKWQDYWYFHDTDTLIIDQMQFEITGLNDEVKILDIEYLNNDLGKKLLEPFYKDNKIEKLSILTFSDLMDMEKEDLVVVIKEQRFKINKLIDEVNKLKESDK